MTPYIIVLAVFAFRLLNALSITTFAQPDEYWQSLEVAHVWVFGYGHLTYEWTQGIRSALYPSIFALCYQLLKLMGLDGNVTSMNRFICVPQALLATCADLWTYKLALKLTKNRFVALWALAASLGSAYNWYMSTRTFSNSLEMALTGAILCLWDPASPSASALFLALLSCVMRPTAAIIWTCYGMHSFLFACSNKLVLAKRVIGCAMVALCVGVLVDYAFYKRLCFPALKFLQFNVLQSISTFYGVSGFHYYISQGLPILLMGYLPLVLVEMTSCRRLESHSVTVLLVTFMYSLLSHKEVRFLYPLTPLLHVLVARALFKMKHARTAFIFAMCLNVPMALYMSTFHQSGVLSVMDYIAHEPAVTSVGFLMPCHSTPWQSHVHRSDVDMWFLTCEPPLSLSKQERALYVDESDMFYRDPTLFIKKHLQPTTSRTNPQAKFWPSHLVFFQALEPELTKLIAPEYHEVSGSAKINSSNSVRGFSILIYMKTRVAAGVCLFTVVSCTQQSN